MRNWRRRFGAINLRSRPSFAKRLRNKSSGRRRMWRRVLSISCGPSMGPSTAPPISQAIHAIWRGLVVEELVIGDKGPLVAFLVDVDSHHSWAVERFKEFPAPFESTAAVKSR